MVRKAASPLIKSTVAAARLATPASAQATAALSLLGAVAFSINLADDSLDWDDRTALADLLKTPANRLPATQVDFSSLLSSKSQTLRHEAIRALGPDNDVYAVTYPITAVDGSRLWLEERGMHVHSGETTHQIIHSVLRDVSEDKHNGMRKAYDAAQSTKKPSPIAAPITENDILAALKDKALSLAYQPIVIAATREIHHYECLLRRQTPNGGIMSAADYIIAAETLGCIHLLDKRALDIGIKTLRSDPNIHLAFNVSAGTIESEFAAKNYLSALKALGPDAQRVTLELTETLALKDDHHAALFSEKAKALGCHFAIDDFGTGHTTFKNLMNIHADILKIDGSMIKDLSESPCKQAFVRIMVDMARTFGIETVAEMVSNFEDAAMLEKMGVTYFQSYIFGRPEPKPAAKIAL
ncbi:MAG: EAL domain-containing protein [Alphaproteobacteria bacterium]